jgi:hypothetical protein
MQLAVARKRNQPDTPAPPNRIAASRFAPLGWWGVVNTRTLDDIGPQILRVIFCILLVIAIGIREEHEVFQVSRDLGTACLAFKIKFERQLER